MKLLICGDICPTSDYMELFDNPDKLFNDVISLFNQSDYLLCNFECPATDHNKKIVKTGPSLKANPSHVNMLSNIGFNAFSLANNHVLDYGSTGLIDTLKYAKKYNVSVFGAGENCFDAKKPLYIKLKNKTIGFISFAEYEFNIATESTPGANLFDPYTSLKDIENARKDCDYLIVLYHGGIEHYKYPSPLLQKKCRAMVDAGANLVLCQHSHCIGTYETYENSTILYGQGNCVFGYRKGNKMWNEGLILELDIDEEIEIKYHLIKATENGITLDLSNNRLEEFYSDSNKILNSQFLKDEFAKFCKERSALDLPLFYAKNRVFIKLNRILGGKLFRIKKNNIMITHNLIRCDAWNELIQENFKNIFNDN